MSRNPSPKLRSWLSQLPLLYLVSTALGSVSTTTYEAGSYANQQPILQTSEKIPAPPPSEAIDIVELPLPPVSASKETGACTADLNARRTGCIAQNLGANGQGPKFQSGDFTPDGGSVIATVTFVGAPTAPDPASIYDGIQAILIKTDGTVFSTGDPWKCLTCGIPSQNALSLDPDKGYPHVFRSGDKAIWGHNILECEGEQLDSDSCTPDRTHIYPIYWPNATTNPESGGSPRELRVHPDGVHIGWSSFTKVGGQYSYFGRLSFNVAPATGELKVSRYDLVDVDLLVDPERQAFITTNGTEMYLHPDSIMIGELRGFSGSGDEITYIGAPTESNNIDVYAVHMVTGAVRRLTNHPDYADPIAFSADDQWFVTQDTRATERQMWMSGMRGIPPLVDIVSTAVAASTRNNGPRRFFQPILIDWYGDRGSYYGQLVNAEGDGSNGSINDPNWNGRADPAFSLDSTRIVYWQAIVTSPSCGGGNPLPCPISTAQGGREYRVMLARLRNRTPSPPAPVYKVPEHVPWATRFSRIVNLPPRFALKPGRYTLRGKKSGHADVRLIGNVEKNSITRVAANYTNYSDDGEHILDGWEDVERTILYPNVWNQRLDWYSDIKQTGAVKANKATSKGGLHLRIDVLTNVLEANGTLTTTVDGVEYQQPANGT